MKARSHLTEAEVQRVIARAIELDASRADQVSITALEEVAAELGISPEAVSQAVAELERPGPSLIAPTTSPEGPARISPERATFLICATAFLVGAAQGHKVEQANFFLLVLTAAAALIYRRTGRAGSYLRHMGSVWVGYGLGWFLASGMVNEGDTAFHLIVPGLTGMAIGWLILKVRSSRIAQMAAWMEPPSTSQSE